MDERQIRTVVQADAREPVDDGFLEVPVRCCGFPHHRSRIRARPGRIVVAVASAECPECGRMVKRLDEGPDPRSGA